MKIAGTLCKSHVASRSVQATSIVGSVSPVAATKAAAVSQDGSTLEEMLKMPTVRILASAECAGQAASACGGSL